MLLSPSKLLHAKTLLTSPLRTFTSLHPKPKLKRRSFVASYNPKEVLLIKDSEKVKHKLRHFINKGGLSNLCILTDFDYTLTRYSLDGVHKLDASFACIRNVFNLLLTCI